MRDIRSIDKDSNGYALISELDKIFRSHFPKQLEGKTLSKLLKPFSSIQNRNLIEYKKFNMYIYKKIKL